ncbi:radical SAM protein [Thermoproteota archaeon]
MELNPKTIVWEYTLKCNSRCLHCGSDADGKRKDELTTEEALALVDDAADIGFDLIVLSGGEPTVRRDWVQTAERIREKDIELGVISNALAWKPEFYDSFSRLDPYAVGLSLDGEEELHDFLRGVSGSHKQVFDTIRELKKRDVTVCAITSVNGLNIDELVMMRNRIMVYDIDAWQLQLASPMGRMAGNKELVVDADQHYRLGEFILETRERLPHINVQPADCIGYFGSMEERIRDSTWRGCGAGIEGIGIQSEGTVKGCLSIWHPDAVEGNIRDQPLKSIWEDPVKFKYNRAFEIDDLKGDCYGCDHGEECRGGCSSQSTAFFDEFHHAPYCFLKYEQERGDTDG